MKNIYDIRREKQLLYILPENSDRDSIKEDLSAVVAVNLYYEDTVGYYMKYINTLPESIDVYVFSSQDRVLHKADGLKTRKLFLIKKDNRGRDISALLVAFKPYFLKYEYICFLHDKKEKHGRAKNDTDIWIKNLWENMIGSVGYVKNIFKTFEENGSVGLLVPPEPMEEYYDVWYGDTWRSDFENTESLARRMDLAADISQEKMPFTIGTVFWARTKCLHKLWKVDWKYEDFPKEPMVDDGTISHAIERILGYVAQDAGYDTGTVMSEEYASWLMLYVQESMRKAYSVLYNRLGIRTLYQLEIYDKQEERIRSFCQKNEEVYLYGAGTYGKSILQIMRNMGYRPKGFVVSNGKRTKEQLEGIDIYELDEVVSEANIGIIIAVEFKLQKEIEKSLKEKGMDNYIKGLF